MYDKSAPKLADHPGTRELAAAGIRLRKILAGAVIVEPHMRPDHVYWLIRGEVAVSANGAAAVTLHRVGDLFGETTLLDAPGTLSVVARTTVAVICVAAADLAKYRGLDGTELRRRLMALFADWFSRKLDAVCSLREIGLDTITGGAGNTAQLERSCAELRSARDYLDKTRRDLEIANTQINRISSEFERFVHKPFLTPAKPGEATDMFGHLRPGHRPEEEEVTILFSDTRSFSTLSEMMSSRDTFDFLNSYMARMEPCITRSNGYIDKLIGDAIMAIFHNADDAVAAACAMEEAIMDYNSKRLRDGRNPISSGIGINTGPVMIGLLGTMAHLDSTVIGDAVNLTSRLETLTKLYGVRILISEFTYGQLADTRHIRLIDRVRVKGRESPVGIYEVYGFGDEDLIEQKTRTQAKFQQAFELYLEGAFEDAASLFSECCGESTRDLVSRVYVARCRYLKDNLPPTAWDGIFQKRASRFDVGDVPGKLYFEHSLHTQAFQEIFIRNISESGVLPLIGRDIELYIGERVLVEFGLPNFDEPGENSRVIQSMTCQVTRGKPGIFSDGKPCWEYGLEFYEMTWAQRHALQMVLPKQ